MTTNFPFLKSLSETASEKRYLVQPLGLAYDDLIQAAIVATKRENAGNQVFDREDERVLTRQELLAIIAANKAPEPVSAPSENHSFGF